MPDPEPWSWRISTVVACLAAFACWGVVLAIGWAVYAALR